jgi:photosystem II stability/assembly factor-like uncharacterized protein
MLLVSATAVEAKWVKQKTDTFAWLRTIHFVDKNTGWIGGSKGAYLTTGDGGKTWQPGTKFTTDMIRTIYFVDADRGWALCERDTFKLGSQAPSYLMRTLDGGVTWQKSEFRNSNRKRIAAMAFAKSGYGIAVGEMGTLYGLEEDNLTWAKQTPPTKYLMLDAAFSSDGLSGAMVGGGGVILFTEDAGTSWNKAVISEGSGGMLKSVFFANASDGWSVGSSGKVYQTINGGRYWRLQKSGTTSTLNSVYFHNNADGWAIGEHGTILRTSTGGNVWNSMRSNSRHHLEDIEFVGDQGWIVGFGGTLLRWDPVYKGKSPRLNR